MDDSERATINRRIAELEGYHAVSTEHYSQAWWHIEKDGVRYWQHGTVQPPGVWERQATPEEAFAVQCPDYCGDLNLTLPKLATVERGCKLEIVCSIIDCTVALLRFFDDSPWVGSGYSEAVRADGDTLSEAAALCYLAYLEARAVGGKG